MKITLKKHPELKPANELLKIFPKAIIAGGVARDLINGKGFKSVDIFIFARTDVELAKISFEIANLVIDEKPSFDENYYMANSLIRIGIANLDICLHTVKFGNAEELVSTFDMILSQAWLEPTNDGFEVKATDLFHHFNKRKILGFYANVSRGSDHISRIREKYPDYLPLSLVQPATGDGFDDMPFFKP